MSKSKINAWRIKSRKIMKEKSERNKGKMMNDCRERIDMAVF